MKKFICIEPTTDAGEYTAHVHEARRYTSFQLDGDLDNDTDEVLIKVPSLEGWKQAYDKAGNKLVLTNLANHITVIGMGIFKFEKPASPGGNSGLIWWRR